MTLLVSALMLPAVIYLVWRLLSIIRSNNNLRLIWWQRGIPLFLLSFYLLPISAFLDFTVTGNIDLLKYPPPVMYWFWFGLVFSYNLATWVIIADMVKLVSRFTSRSDFIARLHRRIVLMLFPLILLFTGAKMYIDTTDIVVEKQTYEMENLPQAMEGFRIIHISDIQGDEFTGRNDIADYIERVNAQEGDLVIFTGDLVSYGTDYIAMSAEEFGRVKADHGAIAVVGDHDFWAGLEHVEPVLADKGIPLLQNENRVIQVDSTASLLVTGVIEVYSRRSDPEEMEELMQESGNHSVKILASHQVAPYLVERAKDLSYNLFLAGHTHGGQIRVPFLGMTFSASERETNYIRGSYRLEDLLIHVNNGLGFTLAPVRYNARPNISVIELRSKEE